MKRTIPRSDLGQEAYWHMKARKKDAQDLFNEAAKAGASLDEALRFASRQIRAGRRAQLVYREELSREREIEELERRAAQNRLREIREEEWLEADQGEAEMKRKPFELSALALRLWFNSPRYQRRIAGSRAGEYTHTKAAVPAEDRESSGDSSDTEKCQNCGGTRTAEERESNRCRGCESLEDTELSDKLVEEEEGMGLPEDLEL